LEQINGKPMLQHVYEIALSTPAKSITVATDSTVIMDACKRFNAPCILSEEYCSSGTDRLALAVEHFNWDDKEIVVNLQGDEPLMPSSLLVQAAEELEYFQDIECDIATLFTYSKDFNNPNDVKVVSDEYGCAMYFSRHDIPYGAISLKRHIGVYAYRVNFLRNFGKMRKCGIELGERLEQLRAIYHGAKIRVEEAVEIPGPDVNVPEDIERIEAILKSR
jgi:3-deoxy-manno-octulosonate cytidylyltransferase (CMP-KDO synthetase)